MTQLIQPNLVEYNTLKKLLRHSYNEGATPFSQIVSKYSTDIKDNWFNIVVIIFIIIMIVLIVNKKKPTIIEEPDIDNEELPKQKKYNNINEYYTKNFRLYKK